MKYKDFFDIDPEYFPQVNEAVIKSKPDMWKSFYPHEAFVRLMKDTINVLSRGQKVSLWVEGAYGTGKSYAVLTMLKLLESTDEEVEAYFAKYSSQLDADLKNRFLQAKGGSILTVHRYGSANIRGDDSLAIAVQDSIMEALSRKGLSSKASEGALKAATLRWLESPANRQYFNTLMKGDYVDTFTGDTVDDLIRKLETFSGISLENLMGKVLKVGREQGIQAMKLQMDDLVKWIKAIIEENKLKAIVFTWDEFTEYFRSNMRALTGFQELVDLSATTPFYLMLVTHNVRNEFPEGNQDWRKISGRFHQPFCEITLPENIAFRLMGAAMTKKQDVQVRKQWQMIADDLYNRTRSSRKLVQDKAGITEKELKEILPIQPYAALLLKHISSAFASNQRSMFDFVKNDRGDDIKGFQWFIQNRGPYDDGNPLLTIDLLWDFFYEKGRDHLSQDIQNILDTFPRVERQLDSEQKRVLKTVLMLQAISHRAGDSVELFIPNDKNIDLAFEGSDLGNHGQASRAASSIADLRILHKDVSGGRNQYSALINAADTAEIERLKEIKRQTTTAALLQEGNMAEALALSGSLRLRYETTMATSADFRQRLNQARAQADAGGNSIQAVYCFAKSDNEGIDISRKIQEQVSDPRNEFVFVDASMIPLGHELFEQYVDAAANAAYQSGKDNALARQYDATAKEVLRKWRNRVSSGEFMVYATAKPQGARLNTIEDLHNHLQAINRHFYPEGLETMGSVNDTMWQSNSLAAGVQCGANQEPVGQYRSGNALTKLERLIGQDAWQKPRYWVDHPHLPISQLKTKVDGMVHAAFEDSGRVAISSIYAFLKATPYGFMPCNLTAFVMGFLLKEYATGNFSYSDGLTSDILNVEKLKEMVSDIIKHQITPIQRYKDKFIVTMTPEEKAFNEASAQIFGINRNLCTSVEQTRGQIRNRMKDLAFPIWVLKSILKDATLKNKPDTVAQLIDGYSGIANSQNVGPSKTDNDIAQGIGRLLLTHEGLAEDLQPLLNRESCTSGMEAYLDTFDEGILIHLSKEVGDNGQYINQLRKKFSADAATWVWNQETAHQKIREVILDYQIIVASNKVLGKSISYDEAIREWISACRNIRISYLFAYNHWEELSPLMEMLQQVKKNGALMDAQKQRFLEQISINGDVFHRFYINQEQMFVRVCEYLLRGLPEESFSVIYRNLPLDLFTSEKAEFQARVEDAVNKHKEEQESLRLREIWAQKAGSQSPQEWSRTNRMPIMALVPESEQQKAKEAFDALHRNSPERAVVQKAIDYLSEASFFEAMKDAKKCQQAFKERIIKGLQVMLVDVDAVKDYLFSIGLRDPYTWYQSAEVERRLHQMAEDKYTREGSAKALHVIDGMETQDLKRYLKELIRGNMTVGMAIIKESGRQT